MSDDKEANADHIPDGQQVAAEAAAKPAAMPRALVTRRGQTGGDKFLEACHATLASIGATQTAMASDLAAMALEFGELTRSNLTATGDSVTALFGARTMVDAVEIQLGLTRRGFGAMAQGSARLNEIGLRLFSGASKSFVAPFVAR